MQFVRGEFVEAYDPTLEDSFVKRIELGPGLALTVEILDTAGTDQITAMRDMYINSGDAFLIAYSVDSRASFNEAVALHERILRLRPKKVLPRKDTSDSALSLTTPFQCPVLMVANKKDLPSGFRRVTYEQGAYIAHQRRCGFMETSARRDENVEQAFLAVLNLFINQNPHMVVARSGKEKHSKGFLAGNQAAALQRNEKPISLGKTKKKHGCSIS
jgi:GTPase SAR1 family protein